MRRARSTTTTSSRLGSGAASSATSSSPATTCPALALSTSPTRRTRGRSRTPIRRRSRTASRAATGRPIGTTATSTSRISYGLLTWRINDPRVRGTTGRRTRTRRPRSSRSTPGTVAATTMTTTIAAAATTTSVRGAAGRRAKELPLGAADPQPRGRDPHRWERQRAEPIPPRGSQDGVIVVGDANRVARNWLSGTGCPDECGFGVSLEADRQRDRGQRGVRFDQAGIRGSPPESGRRQRRLSPRDHWGSGTESGLSGWGQSGHAEGRRWPLADARLCPAATQRRLGRATRRSARVRTGCRVQGLRRRARRPCRSRGQL